MTAHGRTRIRKIGFPITGTYFWRGVYDPPRERTMTARYDRTCTDVVGNYPNPNGFSSQSLRTSFAVLNGEKYLLVGGQQVIGKQYRACPVALSHSFLGPSTPLPTSTEVSQVTIRAMASTNPNTPVISVPTFAAEMKDIPSMVRDYGRRLLAFRRSGRTWSNAVDRALRSKVTTQQTARSAAEANLTYRWVIAPMVSDLTKIFNVQESIEKRFQVLKNLRDEGMISGNGPSSSTSSIATSSVFVENQLSELVTAVKTVVSTRQIWGSCQWKPTSTGLFTSYNIPSTDHELRALSRRLVTGGTTHELLSTAWELVPWSWLVDWFAEVGAFIRAANNTVHVEPVNRCVMCKRTERATYTLTSKPSWIQLDMNQHWEELVHKHRQVVVSVPPLLPAGLPQLTGNQVSILSSLMALRQRRL